MRKLVILVTLWAVTQAWLISIFFEYRATSSNTFYISILSAFVSVVMIGVFVLGF